MAEGIDFTSCRLIPGRAYNGANGKKIAVEYNGTLYMLKFPPSGRNKPTELSYTNSCFSEHIASSIFNLLGVRAHETMLGTFKVGGKDKIICACKDFTADIKRFLAIYFGASMNGDQMPDVDGEQFYEVEDDEEEN